MSQYVIRLFKDKREIYADDIIIDPRKQWVQYIVPYSHRREMIRMKEVESLREERGGHGFGEPRLFRKDEIPKGWKRPFGA